MIRTFGQPDQDFHRDNHSDTPPDIRTNPRSEIRTPLHSDKSPPLYKEGGCPNTDNTPRSPA